MNIKRYSIIDVNNIVNRTTKEITDQYYGKMDMRDIGVMNTYIWNLLENFKSTVDERELKE